MSAMATFAFLRVTGGDGLAEPAGGAGDDCDLVVEFRSAISARKWKGKLSL
jgi:hypothetical protein